MTDRQPPEDHPFSEFFREGSREEPAAAQATTRREQREASDRRAPARPPRNNRRRKLIMRLVVTVVILGLIGGAGTFLYSTFATQITAMLKPESKDDYSGEGSGEVTVTVNDGEFGEAISVKLQEAGVIKDSDTFYSLLLTQSPQPVFQTGTFKLAAKMSSQAALDALVDPANKVDYVVGFVEGSSVKAIFKEIAKVTGIPLADIDAAGANYTALGVPAEAPSIEGFLFPAQYDFQPGQTATEILQTMVNRTFQSLDANGVAATDRLRVLTLAALIQKEAGSVEDMAKVSRVFQNRLAQGMNLQSDATVRYGAGGTDVATTDEEREDESNLYNTYVHSGLPVGPISNPGDDAINAALAPAEGNWLYFVTVNLDTGETVFSDTIEEHDAAVEQLQEWWKEHPDVK